MIKSSRTKKSDVIRLVLRGKKICDSQTEICVSCIRFNGEFMRVQQYNKKIYTVSIKNICTLDEEFSAS